MVLVPVPPRLCAACCGPARCPFVGCGRAAFGSHLRQWLRLCGFRCSHRQHCQRGGRHCSSEEPAPPPRVSRRWLCAVSGRFCVHLGPLQRSRSSLFQVRHVVHPHPRMAGVVPDALPARCRCGGGRRFVPLSPPTSGSRICAHCRRRRARRCQCGLQRAAGCGRLQRDCREDGARRCVGRWGRTRRTSLVLRPGRLEPRAPTTETSPEGWGEFERGKPVPTLNTHPQAAEGCRGAQKAAGGRPTLALCF